MIRFNCAHCQKPLTAADSLQGVTSPCPYCEGPVAVPRAVRSRSGTGFRFFRKITSLGSVDATEPGVGRAPLPSRPPVTARRRRLAMYVVLSGAAVAAVGCVLAAASFLPLPPSLLATVRERPWVAYGSLVLLLTTALLVGMVTWFRRVHRAGPAHPPRSDRGPRRAGGAAPSATPAWGQAVLGGTTSVVLSGILGTAVLYGALWTGVGEGYLFDFFVARGVFQYLSTFLFFVGLAACVSRHVGMRGEERGLELKLPRQTLEPDDAATLASQILSQSKAGSLRRRIAELLRGYASGEQPRPLMEILTAKSREEIEAGHALIASVRGALPVMGLLGTVVGLSQAMLHFTSISSTTEIESLRGILQQFAKSSSTAFDTTLLGLSYMLILSIALLAISAQEERLVATLQNSMESIRRTFHERQPAAASVAQAVHGATLQVMRHLDHALTEATARAMEAFQGELRNGTGAVVHGYLQSWRDELLRTSREVLDAVVSENRRLNAEAEKPIEAGLNLLASKLDAMGRALERPQPVRIKIIGENGGHGEQSYGQVAAQ